MHLSACFRIVCRRLMPMIAGLVAASHMWAAGPERLAEYTAPYVDLVRAGPQVWGVVYPTYATPLGVCSLLVENGAAASGPSINLPDRTSRVAVGPGGIFYAVAEGTETDLNPSLHLWRRTGDSGWENVGLVSHANWNIGVTQADITIAADTVIVALKPQDIWPLAVYQPSTGTMRFGPRGVSEVMGSLPVFASLQIQGPGYVATRVHRSLDGFSWEPVLIPQSAINNSFGSWSLSDPPLQAIGGDTLWMEGGSVWFNPQLKVATANGVTVEYAIPFSQNGFGSSAPEAPVEERFFPPTELTMTVGRWGERAASSC